MRKIPFILAGLFCFVILISTDIGAEELQKEWKTRIELSYVKTSGNTDAQTLSVKLEIKREGPMNRYFLTGKGLYAKKDGQEISNKLSLDGRWERIITERLFGFLTTGYSRDKFSGYASRIYGGPGLGYDLIKTEHQGLQSLISLIYYYDRFSVGEADSDNYLTGKATAKYEWRILENLKFKEILDYFVSFKDTDRYFINSETSVEVKINSALSLGVSYIINYQSQPPSPELEDTDTTFLTMLIIDF